jgi:hypothetical protein
MTSVSTGSTQRSVSSRYGVSGYAARRSEFARTAAQRIEHLGGAPQLLEEHRVLGAAVIKCLLIWHLVAASLVLGQVG